MGARWQTVYQMDLGDGEAQVTLTFEILEIHDDRVVGRVDGFHTTAPGTFSEGGNEIVSSEMRLTGTLTWLLTAGVVLQDANVTIDMVMRSTSEAVIFDTHVASEMTIRETIR